MHEDMDIDMCKVLMDEFDTPCIYCVLFSFNLIFRWLNMSNIGKIPGGKDIKIISHLGPHLLIIFPRDVDPILSILMKKIEVRALISIFQLFLSQGTYNTGIDKNKLSEHVYGLTFV